MVLSKNLKSFKCGLLGPIWESQPVDPIWVLSQFFFFLLFQVCTPIIFLLFHAPMVPFGLSTPIFSPQSPNSTMGNTHEEDEEPSHRENQSLHLTYLSNSSNAISTVKREESLKFHNRKHPRWFHHKNKFNQNEEPSQTEKQALASHTCLKFECNFHDQTWEINPSPNLYAIYTHTHATKILITSPPLVLL